MTTLALLTVLAAGAPGTPPGLGVMDFAAQGGATNELASAVATLTAQELDRLGVFKVTSAEAMRVMLGVERQRALLGCDNCSGTALADLNNFEFIITGKVMKTGKSEWTLFMSLLPVGSSAALSSTRATANSETALLQEVKPQTLKLVGKVLQGKQGSLVVTASEVGAAVKFDDSQVGTTPLNGALPLAAGPHLLTVEKDGFSTVRKEVRITTDQISEETIRLVPSPDTIDAYESRAMRLRVLAWVAAGLALGGATAFVIGEARATSIYGDTNTLGSFQYHRAALLKGIEEEPLLDSKGQPVLNPDGTAQTINHRAAATTLKNQISTFETVSYVGIGLAGAGAIASAVLFIIGDQPGKYDAYKRAPAPAGSTSPPAAPAPAPAPKVMIAPTLGGVVLVGTF